MFVTGLGFSDQLCGSLTKATEPKGRQPGVLYFSGPAASVNGKWISFCYAGSSTSEPGTELSVAWIELGTTSRFRSNVDLKYILQTEDKHGPQTVIPD